MTEFPFHPTPGPYATAAPIYQHHGWTNPLPIPPGQKGPVPTGYTGHDGTTPTAEQINTWATRMPDGNIALRMPPNIIGIDVDQYDNKHGGDQLALAETTLGPLPPTWWSSARPAPSGIRFYRVPPGSKYRGKAAPDIDVIQHHHRYAVVWPSVNPKTDSVYLWWGPDNQPSDPPHVDQLPELPATWHAWLTEQPTHLNGDRRPTLPGEKSDAVKRALGKALYELPGNRHDSTMAGVTALTRLATEGHPGAQDAIDELRRAFTGTVTADGTRTDRDAQAEWDRMLNAAERTVAGTPALRPAWDELAQPRNGNDWAWTGITPDGKHWTGDGQDPTLEQQPHGWEPADLTEHLNGTYTPITPTILTRTDGHALFYPNRINALYGESGAGKTWLALHAVHQELTVGHHVLYIDLEDHAGSVTGRLIALGADPATIARQFHYVAPEAPWSPQAETATLELAEHHQIALAVIDSTGEAMALQGHKPNDDDDTARWFRLIPRQLCRHGITVALIDHLPKNDEAAKKGAIGSQRKKAAIDGAAYLVDASVAPAKGVTGHLAVNVVKDRNGTYQRGARAADCRIDSDPAGTQVTVELTRHEKVTRPTALMERVSRHLEQHGPTSARTLAREVKGNTDWIRVAIAVLIDEGHVENEMRSGKGGGTNLRSVKPFRDPTAPTAPQPRPSDPWARLDEEEPNRAHRAQTAPTPKMGAVANAVNRAHAAPPHGGHGRGLQQDTERASEEDQGNQPRPPDQPAPTAPLTATRGRGCAPDIPTTPPTI